LTTGLGSPNNEDAVEEFADWIPNLDPGEIAEVELQAERLELEQMEMGWR